MSLILLTGMLISPATAQTIGEEITFKGAQGTIAASETGLYIVRLTEPSLAAYQAELPDYKRPAQRSRARVNWMSTPPPARLTLPS